jgi:HAD superfamily hydrolase (TIGR01509 family)
MKQKDLLVFDVMGVIFPFPEGDDIKYGLLHFFKHKGVVLSKKEQYRLEIELYRAATRGKISSIQYLQEFLPKDITPQSFEEEYLHSPLFVLDSNLFPTLKALQEKFSIGILSNDIGNWNTTLRKRFSLDQYFDVIVISSDAKARKPDKKIYQYLLDQVNIKGLRPKNIYFVDDSLKNLKSANEMGITTIYRILRTNDKEKYKPDFEINTLNELETLW